MFKVKTMQPKDFLFATELANTMDWNMAPEDFQFNLMLEPEGCLILFDDSKPLGIATCISYGKVGWFGNLIVKEEARHRKAGSLLVKHAINYLQTKGVETIGLYAYPNLQNFTQIWVLKRMRKLLSSKPKVLSLHIKKSFRKLGKTTFKLQSSLIENVLAATDKTT